MTKYEMNADDVVDMRPRGDLARKRARQGSRSLMQTPAGWWSLGRPGGPAEVRLMSTWGRGGKGEEGGEREEEGRSREGRGEGRGEAGPEAGPQSEAEAAGNWRAGPGPRPEPDKGRINEEARRGGEKGTGTRQLSHVSESGAARMVCISEKTVSCREAAAACSLRFSDGRAVELIRAGAMKKGDVMSVARVAGIMAAKRTAELIPLCHPIALTFVGVELEADEGGRRMEIRARVRSEGKTGVEMEALTAAATAALTVYDMCKAVDRGIVVEGLRVILKEGGKGGRWEAA